jgi:hypothetical protein
MIIQSDSKLLLGFTLPKKGDLDNNLELLCISVLKKRKKTIVIPVLN